MKYILLVGLLSFSVLCIGQDKEIIFREYETHPSFPGGETEMYKFIQSKFYYPQSALKDSIQGRVITRFLVRKTGDVDSIKVIKGIHPECDKVAMDILKAMPKWNPGSQMGRNIDVWFTLPIKFKLPDVEIVKSPNQLPTFPNGDNALYDFIIKNKKYPVVEHECYEGHCCQGRIIIRFIVTKEGKIQLPEIVKGLTPILNKEALRVVNIMPDWIPAKHKGENVDAYYILPIVFRRN